MTTEECPKLDSTALHWIEGPENDGMRPRIAVRAEYRPRSSTLCFHDGNRPRQLDAKFVSGTENTGLVFGQPEGGTLIVRRLDVDTFDRLFRPLIDDLPIFASDDDLCAFYAGAVSER